MNAFAETDGQSLPTAQPFIGRTIVMSIDAATVESATLVQDLVFMRNLGVRPVLVHDAVEPACGPRLTGLINRIGGEAVALDGTSASTIMVSADESGTNVVRSVNAQLLLLLLQQGYIPVFAAQGTSISGMPAVVDAAEAAQILAAAMQAVRLLYTSASGGIPAAGDGIIDELTSSEALALASTGTLARGLSKQLKAAALGVRAGVDAAQLLDLTASHASLVELLTAQHLGTQIVSNIVLS